MRSLIHITESVRSSKYLNKLQDFVRSQYDQFPYLHIIFPECLIPYGNGSAEELGDITTSENSTIKEVRYGDKVPVIGITKIDGKVYLVIRLLHPVKSFDVENYELFDDLYDYYSYKYYNAYHFCDITDRYDGNIKSIASRCNLYYLSSKGPDVTDIWNYNNGLYMKFDEDKTINSIYKKTEGSVEEAREAYNRLTRSNIELYTIDWSILEKKFKSNGKTKQPQNWDGDTDQLYKILLRRGAIMRELDTWLNELTGKVRWYAKNKIGISGTRMKTVTEEIESFYKTLATTRDQLRNFLDGKSDKFDPQFIYKFIRHFDRTLLSVPGAKSNSRVYMGIKVNGVKEYKYYNGLTTFYTLIKKPFTEPAGAPDDAPSFQMETECPTLIKLADVMYNTQAQSQIYSVYLQYKKTL